ncbi:hypothetical protein [Winogradskya humida]|uniref:Uncharacterized protein n=1 Tax=Winogradskya humida TaxID=113566 RepID=A0ABQ3ZF86_9ACTN|nr:hypothetical protein [Actinoplanes humidus]GIE17168.1 hypothetical protein Ahu01nite_002700 [Actinoplanes humidus]
MPRLGPTLAATAILALTACSDTPGNSTSTTNIPSIAISAAGSYRDCLEENGIDTSDIPAGPIPSGPIPGIPGGPGGAMPPGGPGGPGGAMPSGGPGGPGGPMPPGSPGGPGPGVPGGGLGVLTSKPAGVSDETWTRAQKTCASLAPTP